MPLFVLALKCIVCLAAYLGLAAALGLGGPEFCGAPASPTHPFVWIVSALLVVTGLASLIVRKSTAR